MSVTVTTTDQGGLSYAETFTISVNDLAYSTPYISDIIPSGGIYTSDDISIDSLLLGFTYDLDYNPNTPLTITYSLIRTDSVFDSQYGDAVDDLGDEFTDRIVNGSVAWEALVDQAFAYWGQVSGINFVKVEETSTQCGLSLIHI